MPSLSAIAMLACVLSVLVTIFNMNSGLSYASDILVQFFLFRAPDVEFLYTHRMRLCIICILTVCVALLTLFADAVMINARRTGRPTSPLCEGPVPCILVSVRV